MLDIQVKMTCTIYEHRLFNSRPQLRLDRLFYCLVLEVYLLRGLLQFTGLRQPAIVHTLRYVTIPRV